MILLHYRFSLRSTVITSNLLSHIDITAWYREAYAQKALDERRVDDVVLFHMNCHRYSTHLKTNFFLRYDHFATRFRKKSLLLGLFYNLREGNEICSMVFIRPMFSQEGWSLFEWLSTKQGGSKATFRNLMFLGPAPWRSTDEIIFRPCYYNCP